MSTKMPMLLLAAMLLVLGSGNPAGAAQQLCVLDPAQMPESWRPPEWQEKSLNRAPWSQREAKDVTRAIEKGVDEMIAYFDRTPSVLKIPWGDAIESLIQSTYASANAPELDAKVREAARKNLSALIELSLERNPDPQQVTCGDFVRLLPLAIFSHQLLPADDPRTARITTLTNAASRACGSLEAATGFDHRKILADDKASPEELLELYIWALWFIEAELYPDIELPAEAGGYGQALWNYFKTYHLAAADEFDEGPWDDRFVAMADLAPHIAHMPTGTHRFALHVEDHPDLYRYHRENFYAVMELGELDLLASFVDTLRQYGCTPENDVQVRDGTRFLLKTFHKFNDSWIAYRQEGETTADLDDYDIVHYPWTAVLGLRDRRPEPPEPGTYGGLFRSWQPHPAD